MKISRFFYHEDGEPNFESVIVIMILLFIIYIIVVIARALGVHPIL